MRFTHEYCKLKLKYFTTIRKNTGFYKLGRVYTIHTPNQHFRAEVVTIKPIKKADITDEFAWKDADCNAKTLKEILEKWYGKKYDDFVILSLRKVKEK